MRALLLQDYLHLELADLPVPQPGPDDVLVRVRACGICGSDVHGFDGSSGRRIPPLVMGHEAAGIISEVGSNVSRFKNGDRVTFDSTVFCGSCFYCRGGHVNLCDRRQVLGVSCGEYRRHGAFAEYVAVPQQTVYPLPDSIEFKHAAFIEAISVALHAIRRQPIPSEATVVVVGSGMIGLLILQALRATGSNRIVAVDIDDSKLKLARQMGADVQLNSKSSDVVSCVQEYTQGRGADLAIEAVGLTEPIETAVNCVRKGGTVIAVGNLAPTIELPLQSVVTRELKFLGSCGSAGEYPEAIQLLGEGKIRVDPLISAVAPLPEGPSWFRRLYNNEPNLIKVILQP